MHDLSGHYVKQASFLFMEFSPRFSEKAIYYPPNARQACEQKYLELKANASGPLHEMLSIIDLRNNGMRAILTQIVWPEMHKELVALPHIGKARRETLCKEVISGYWPQTATALLKNPSNFQRQLEASKQTRDLEKALGIQNGRAYRFDDKSVRVLRSWIYSYNKENGAS